jgi:predicted metal-dependent peptidase
MENKNLNLFKALLILESKSPDLFQFMTLTDIILNDKTCPSAYAAIDKQKQKFKIVIGERFSQFDAFNLAALIEHELLHIALNHCLVQTGQKSEFKNKELLNIAMDSIINSIGTLISQRKNLNKELQGGVFIGDLSKQLGVFLSAQTHTTKMIYQALDALSERQKENLTKSFDLGLEGENETLESESMNEIIESCPDLKNTIEAMAKNRGASKDFKNLGLELIKKEKNRLLQSAVMSFLASQKQTEKKTSWRRPSRRYIGQKGRIRAKNQSILLAIDTSGSMLDPDTLKKMQSVVSSAMSYEYNIDLVLGDTQKRDFQTNIKKLRIDKTDLFKGGGGTQLKFIAEQYTQKDYDGILILTDLEIDFRDFQDLPKNKTMIFCTSNQYDKNQAQKIARKVLKV